MNRPVTPLSHGNSARLVVPRSRGLAGAGQRGTNVAWVPLLAALLFLAARLPARAQPAPPRTGLDAVLERFGDNVLFHASFDGTADAAMAAGNPTGTVSEGQGAYAPGKCGQALAGGTIRFDGGANFSPAMPGTVLLWLCIQRPLGESKDEGNIFPLRVGLSDAEPKRSGLLMLGKNNGANHAGLYLHVETSGPEGKGRAQAHSVATFGWRPTDWHLIAMTWRPGSIELSVDGAPPSVSTRAPDLPCRADWLLVAATAGGRVLSHVDELLVFDRPLDTAELAWVWETMGKTAPLQAP